MYTMADVDRNTTYLKKTQKNNWRGINDAEMNKCTKLSILLVDSSYPGVLTNIPTGHFFTL